MPMRSTTYFRRPARKPVRKASRRSTIPRGPMRPETKSLVTALTPAANTGGVISLCNVIPKGTTDTTRIGNEVVLRSIRVRGFAAATPGTGVDQLHRYLVVFDKAPSGATPAILDVLNAINVYAFVNEDNAWRFQILADRTIALNATAESGTIRAMDVKLSVSKRVHYNDNSLGDIRDIQSGAVFLITIGTSAAGATAGSFTGNSIVKFIDP